MRFCASLIEDVAKAAKRGDWRAAMSLLERHVMTRADYSPPAAARGPHNPQLTVILDIPMPGSDSGAAPAVVIDHPVTVGK